MFCDNCGNAIANNATQCPVCGTLTNTAQTNQPLGQGQQGQQIPLPQDDFRSFGGPPLYQQGYRPVPNPAPPQGGYMPPPQQVPGYTSASYASIYPQAPITVSVVNSPSNDGALIVEILLSLFGVFGVGWLIGGETTVGVILLICSIFIYWPIMILGTLLTFGLGLICLGPLMIGAIIINALLCNSALKRRASHLVVVQQPPQQMPLPPM